MPEDFSIGPLADEGQGTADEKAALVSAAAFFGSLVRGKPDATLLSAESEAAILDLLAAVTGSEAAPTSIRLGRPVSLPEGEISSNVRLFRGGGTAEGEVYLRKMSSRWLVSDVQVNPAALAVLRQKPDGRFFPSPYRWLLGE